MGINAKGRQTEKLLRRGNNNILGMGTHDRTIHKCVA